MTETLPVTAIRGTRRDLLRFGACGFGSLALAGLASANPRRLHHPPRAKRVIFLFMQGGVSQVDSFDEKPLLAERDGEMLPFHDARSFANSGTLATTQRVMRSPWKFQRYGESGRAVSELFPQVARHVDDLCFLQGMQTEGVAHGPATLFLHCGATTFIRPSMGAWIHYGLGSENENLPGFVSIGASSGNGGARNTGAAFLPAMHQGTVLGRAGQSSREARFRNLVTDPATRDERRADLDFVSRLNAIQKAGRPADEEWNAVADSYHLAWRIQTAAPDVLDLTQETAETHALYGIGESPTDNFGQQCLMARRLCEAGVRYIQVTYGDNSANPAWDQHSNLPKHADHARATDRPVAGLLADLKRRGLLEDTLVWWGGEFGRTPYAEKAGTGRDHNPAGFTVWLAGGGVRPGFAYGETDEFGHQAIRGKVHMHDLHATILHQLGLDHEQLTYRNAGRDFRLTDVAGRVVQEILA
jgi:hypothetical protein